MNVRVPGLFAALAALVGCSSGSSLPSGTAGTGGGAGTGAGGTMGGTSGGGTGGGGSFINAGVCGERGMATVNTTAYDGTAEFYIIGEAGLGVDVCVVRYDVKRMGAAPASCADPTTSTACAWSHTVTFSNPTVVTNEGGACDASDSVPALDAAGAPRSTECPSGAGSRAWPGTAIR